MHNKHLKVPEFIPDTLQNKLTQLSIPTSICQGITCFLTDRQQVMRLGQISSSTCTISTGAPQGCVLSPLLFSLCTNDCTSKDPSVKLLKFADNTTLIGLIQYDDESAYRQQVKELAVRCSLDNLELNTLCDCSTVIQIPGHHNFSGPEVGQSHWVYGGKGPAEAILPVLLRKFNLPQELLIQFYSSLNPSSAHQ